MNSTERTIAWITLVALCVGFLMLMSSIIPNTTWGPLIAGFILFIVTAHGAQRYGLIGIVVNYFIITVLVGVIVFLKWLW